MSKTTTGNFFEDFRLGQIFKHATPRTITEGEAALYIALTGARHLPHSAEPAAIALGYPRRPVDDLLAFHIAFAKTVPDISVNAVANLGYADVRFLQPVYFGDTLSTTSTVIGLKQNSSNKNGIVYVYSVATNQHHQEVLSWVRWVSVIKQNLDAPAPATHIPELPASVAVEDLSIPAFLQANRFDTTLTGGQFLWDDYAVGERINHPGGMTVDNSDHTLATKLYQNNARLHFDELAMQNTPFQTRLIYGGHIISVCRALSYDGLENVLSIAAINGGTHSNPSFGGDTIYTWSEVIDKYAPPGREDIGALRLRLVGLKNLPAHELQETHTDNNGKRVYHPNVVLDLDYTVLIPRKI